MKNMSELSEMQRTIAVQQIHEHQLRRCLAVDTKDWAVHEALHAPDFLGYIADEDRWEAGARPYTDRVALLSANRLTIHYTNVPIVSFETAQSARTVCAMHYRAWWNDDQWLRGYGFYHETLERRGGSWLFTSRRQEILKLSTSHEAGLEQIAST